MLEEKITSKEFYSIDDKDAVSLCLLAILELVLLGQEPRHNVPDWCLRNANVKWWPVFYVTSVEEGDDKPKYTLSGFTWAFRTWILELYRVRALQFFTRVERYPRAVVSRSDGKFYRTFLHRFLLRAFFDGRIREPPRIPSPVNLHSRDDPPVDIYRRMEEQDRAMQELKEKKATHEEMYNK
ncbi:hypothetical protein Tco_1453873 [Tanacetum coccineum]